MKLFIKSSFVLFLATFFFNMHPIFAFELPLEQKKFLQNHEIWENGEISGNKEEVRVFEKYVGENWTEIIASIDKIAPSRPEQCIIFAAAESMPGEEYLRYMAMVCDQAEQQRIDLGALNWAISSFSLGKRCFFAVNYKQPDVIKLMGRFEKIFQKHNDNGKYDSRLKSIKLMMSGDMAVNRHNYAVFAEIKDAGVPPPEILFPGKNKISDSATLSEKWDDFEKDLSDYTTNNRETWGYFLIFGITIFLVGCWVFVKQIRKKL